MDEIIEKVGNFGPFQAMVFAASSLSLTASAFGMMFMMFGLYHPGWTCHNNTSIFERSAEMALNGSTLSYDVPSGVREVSCTLWQTCAKVVPEKSSSTVVTEWNLICDNAWIASMMITIQMVGVLLGSWACGPIGDRYGRKVSLYSSVAVLGVFNLICAFSFSWQMFAACRFFIGFGAGGTVAIAFVYHMEFVGNWWRPVLMSIPMWSLGTVLFAVVSFFLKDWVHIHIATAIVSAMAFLTVFWMPESMRWLAVHGKKDQLHVLVRKMASWNRKTSVGIEEINKTIKSIQEVQRTAEKPTYFDLFKTTRLRKYSFKFGTAWFIIALVYYMITFGVKSFSGDFYTNMIIFTITETPSSLLVGPFSNKFGRRFSTCLFFSLAAMGCFGNVASHFISGPIAQTLSIILVTISKGCLMTSWTLVTVLSTELYPTFVRNLHSGYLNSICRFGVMLSPYMVPSEDSQLFISFIVSGCLLSICVALIASVPDSKRMPMTDCIEELRDPTSDRKLLSRDEE